jgi:DNA-directed RNA polymerase specialized sigma24 family protein
MQAQSNEKGGSMLMRVQEIVDYSHVPDQHKAIHERLENWRRWVIVRPHGWQTHPMWRSALTSRQWDVSPHIAVPVNTLDAVLVEKAVAALPEKQREAIRWSYVHAGNPVAMAKQLAVSKQGLADLVNSGRTMLKNRIGG